MTGTLGFALLGLLARQPLSGYDISTQLKHGLGPFWHAHHSQIYQQLASLERDALIAHHVVQQHDRPDKKVYAVTPAGRQALREWVASPLEAAPIRDEITLRAYSIWLADPARAAALLREQQHLHEAQLAEYERVRAQIEQRGGAAVCRPDTPEFASYATLRRGIGHERELSEWCAWLADSLNRPH